jgi:hypothetical protein
MVIDGEHAEELRQPAVMGGDVTVGHVAPLGGQNLRAAGGFASRSVPDPPPISAAKGLDCDPFSPHHDAKPAESVVVVVDFTFSLPLL